MSIWSRDSLFTTVARRRRKESFKLAQNDKPAPCAPEGIDQMSGAAAEGGRPAGSPNKHAISDSAVAAKACCEFTCRDYPAVDPRQSATSAAVEWQLRERFGVRHDRSMLQSRLCWFAASLGSTSVGLSFAGLLTAVDTSWNFSCSGLGPNIRGRHSSGTSSRGASHNS